jgi:hypothetical protein
MPFLRVEISDATGIYRPIEPQIAAFDQLGRRGNSYAVENIPFRLLRI